MSLTAYTAESVDSTPLTQFRHRAWRTSDGWFDSSILALAQGSDGYLWVGTQSGLLRFDGVRFSPWVPPRGHEALGRVRLLLAARDGAMWIGSGSELLVFKGSELTRVPLADSVIQSIYEDHSGTVWVTRSGLKPGDRPVCKVSVQPVTCYGAADGLTILYATRMTEDRQGYYWLGSGSLVRWKPATPQVEYFADELKSFGGGIAVVDLLTTSDGSVLAGLAAQGDKAGLQSFKDGKWQSMKARGFDGSSGGRVLLEDRDGALWIAPFGSGLIHLVNGQADKFTREDGLSGDRVTSILQDVEGTVWVATNYGLDNFARVPVVAYTAREGMPAGPPSAVAASPDGTVFVATPRPVTIKEGVPQVVPGMAGTLNDGDVQALLVDTMQSVWLAKGNQLYLLRDRKLTVVKTANGADALPIGAIVTAMAEDRHHTIWGLIDGAGLKQLVTITAQGMRDVADLPFGDTGFLMVVDHDDGLWTAGGTNRLNYFHDGKVVNRTLTNVSKDFAARDVLVDSQNRLWVMSTEGIKIIGGGQVRTIGKENGLPCVYLDSGIIDREETLWITSRCGLLRIEAREWRRALELPDAKIHVHQFGASDGWTNGSTVAVPKIAQSADGKIWFAGGADLQMINPSAVAATISKTPPIHIEQVIVDHKPYDPRLPLESIPPNPRELEIDYAAPTALYPQAVRFKYRLVGHDQSWQEPGTRRQAFYSDLKPGSYRFEVAVDGPGNANTLPVDQIDFSVLPAFYQSWWFRVVCTGAVLIGLWSMYAIRLQRVTELLRLRHQERMIERESMARELHDTFFQSVQSLFLRFHTAANRLPDNEPTRRLFEIALDDSDRVMLQGRQVMLDLRAESSKSMTLAEALALAGNDLRSAYQCDFRVTVVGVLRPLFPLVFEELRKFGQEALANAFRHSSAKSIEVEINYGSSEFSVRVRDDGVGIEDGVLKPGFRQGHWGLPGMRERAAKIGGRLEIWSRSGAGTEIELKLPARAAYVTGPRRAFCKRWVPLRR